MVVPHLKMLFVVQMGPSKIELSSVSGSENGRAVVLSMYQEGLTSRKARAFPALENGAGAEPPCRGCWGSGDPFGAPCGAEAALPFPMELTEPGTAGSNPWRGLELHPALLRNPAGPGAGSSSVRSG